LAWKSDAAWPAALALVGSSISPALAQNTLLGMGGPAKTPTASSIDLAPFVATLLPIVGPLAVGAAGAAVTWACTTIARWVGAKRAALIDDGHRAALKEAAEREANVLVAAAADNLAHRSIDVGSPATEAAAKLIAAELPKAIARLGITPAGVERLVVSAIGQTQACMSRTYPQPPAPAAA
jgi:hypothetical protein